MVPSSDGFRVMIAQEARGEHLVLISRASRVPKTSSMSSYALVRWTSPYSLAVPKVSSQQRQYSKGSCAHLNHGVAVLLPALCCTQLAHCNMEYSTLQYTLC